MLHVSDQIRATIGKALGRIPSGLYILTATHEGKGYIAIVGASLSGVLQAKSGPSGSSRYYELRTNAMGEVQVFEIDPREGLLDVLRERLNLTGTKKGCERGACGACTVHFEGLRVLSCHTLAARCGDKSITTIEGIAKFAPKPLSRRGRRGRQWRC